MEPSFATDLSKTFERIRREKEVILTALGEQGIGDVDCIALGGSVAEQAGKQLPS